MAMLDASAHGSGLELGRSVEALRRASGVLARGTSSAVRLRAESPSVVMRHAEGPILTDLDGNEYIDYVLGLGAALLGHRPPVAVDAVDRALAEGWAYGAPHPQEGELAELLVETIPSAEIVALVSTGSEAVHLAARIARAATGRQRLVKFDGHYHGWVDPLFVNAPWVDPIASGPEGAVHNVAGLSPPEGVTVVRWNALDELESALEVGPPVAAVVMEPIPCNFGTFLPAEGYLDAVKELCRRHGALLVFDEVLTGFRMALGGAQERLRASPDLTICSKAIASGMPLALVGGPSKVMRPITDGPIRPAGTYAGSPVAVAAALATVSHLRDDEERIYSHLEESSEALAAGIRAAAAEAQAPLVVNQVGPVLQLLWDVREPVGSYEDACRGDRRRIAVLTGELLRRGVHVGERGLMLVSSAHEPRHIEATVAGFVAALAEVIG